MGSSGYLGTPAQLFDEPSIRTTCPVRGARGFATSGLFRTKATSVSIVCSEGFQVQTTSVALYEVFLWTLEPQSCAFICRHTPACSALGANPHYYAMFIRGHHPSPVTTGCGVCRIRGSLVHLQLLVITVLAHTSTVWTDIHQSSRWDSPEANSKAPWATGLSVTDRKRWPATRQANVELSSGCKRCTAPLSRRAAGSGTSIGNFHWDGLKHWTVIDGNLKIRMDTHLMFIHLMYIL